jgi:modulator of FtsH protease
VLVLTTAYDPARWTDFAVGVVGASATLVGLLFVAVSINLQRILQFKDLPARAGQTLIFLATPLFAALFLLVPAQSGSALAGEIFAVAFLTGAVHLRIGVQSGRSEHELLGFWLANRVVPASATTLCLVLTGATLLWQNGGGLYWLVPGIVIAIAAGIANAWVLLVEILR